MDGGEREKGGGMLVRERERGGVDGWYSGVHIKRETARTLIWDAYRSQHGGQR
jgi:hypothetical protein